MFVEYARPLSPFILALTCSGFRGEVISAESNFPMQKSPKIKCTLFFGLSSCIYVPMMELYRQSKISCTQDVFCVFFKIFVAYCSIPGDFQYILLLHVWSLQKVSFGEAYLFEYCSRNKSTTRCLY